VNHVDRLRRFLVGEGGSLRHKTVRSGFWVALASIGVNSLALVKSIILARLLTPEAFGLMAICMVVMRAVQVFTETGLNAALIQRPGDAASAKDTVYTLAALRGFVLMLLIVVASPFVAAFYERPTLEPLLQVLALGLLFGGLNNIHGVLLQKELNFRPLFRTQQTLAILDFLVAVALAYWWRNVWALVVASVISTTLGVVLSFLLLPGRPRFAWDWRLAKELLSYGKFLTGTSIVVYATTEIDNAVIGKILGMEALGLYVLAYMLANLPATHLGKAIAQIVFPLYSKLQLDRSALHRAYLHTSQVVAVIALPAAVGLAVLAEDIVNVVYGPKWLAAATVIPILCVFGALRAISSISGYVFNAIGRPDVPFYLNLAKLLVIAAVIVPVTSRYGVVGAALAVTVPSAIQLPIGFAVLSRTLQLPIARIVGAISPAVVPSLLMGLALFALDQWRPLGSVQSLALTIAGGGLLYLLLAWSQIRIAVDVITGRTADRP
jgi:O-antigen/teichoic acid export membrane protein